MKKLLIVLALVLVFPFSVFAAEIDIAANKTQITTDETVQISLSVNGQIDNGKLGIEGIDDFDIVGQQSSQKVQILNGTTSIVQEKLLSLQPKKEGEFKITAYAKEGGTEIRSQTISLQVEKSLKQATKEKLLEDLEPISNQTQNTENENLTDNTEKNSAKENLLKEPQIDQSAVNNPEELNPPALSNFPKVEYVSYFNAIFWLESLGIFILLMLIFSGGWWIINKKKK